MGEEDGQRGQRSTSYDGTGGVLELGARQVGLVDP